jgi:SAM-dependent methyltransferase
LNGTTLEITSCEVCGNTHLRPAIDLGRHPMCDDLVAIGDGRMCREYPIEILYCEICRTAHQRFQIPKGELFPATYHYRSRHTADVLNGMRDLVSACEATLGTLAGRKVLDVGCNDGSLLSFFASRGARPFGIEPTNAAADAARQGYAVINDFFSEEVAVDFVRLHGRPDIVTFTNVFAHIEDLKGVILALRQVCHDQTLIVIENHYLGAILEKNQFDTFYHEHPRTYSYTSFVHIASALGRDIVHAEFPKRYGGNIRIFMNDKASARRTGESLEAIGRGEAGLGQGLDRLAKAVRVWRANKSEELDAIVSRHGPLAAKAFPGRAAIPIKMLGLDTSRVSATYEKPGSAKVGHYIPGTRIPIRTDDDFDVTVAGPVLNLAWHISSEINAYLRQRGYAGPIVDIISPGDFVVRK